MDLLDFRENIGYLQGVIASLEQENEFFRLQIERLEGDCVNISSVESKMASLVADYSEAIHCATMQDSCLDECISKLNKILFDKEVLTLSQSTKDIGIRIRLEIDGLEEAIRSNRLRIGRCQDIIHEIETSKKC